MASADGGAGSGEERWVVVKKVSRPERLGVHVVWRCLAYGSLPALTPSCSPPRSLSSAIELGKLSEMAIDFLEGLWKLCLRTEAHLFFPSPSNWPEARSAAALDHHHGKEADSVLHKLENL
jgi:hypothetical protein